MLATAAVKMAAGSVKNLSKLSQQGRELYERTVAFSGSLVRGAERADAWQSQLVARQTDPAPVSRS